MSEKLTKEIVNERIKDRNIVQLNYVQTDISKLYLININKLY